MARLLGGQLHLAPIAGDLFAEDLAVLNVAALCAHGHCASGNGLVFTGFEIAENEDVARSKLDDLPRADIVHEFDGLAKDVDDVNQYADVM